MVNPINLSEGKNPFGNYYMKFYLKDNNKTSHWDGHLKQNPLYLEEYFTGNIMIDKPEANLTGTIIEQSDYGMEKPRMSLWPLKWKMLIQI